MASVWLPDHIDEHRVVKVFSEPELTGLVGEHGWEADIAGARRFLYGTARLRSTRFLSDPLRSI